MDPAPEEKLHCNALGDEEDRTFCIQGYSVKELKFPDEAQGLGFFTSTNKMSVYKPEGKGPFPAAILLHTCGAIDHEHMRYWVKQTPENGYVAFVVDSWGQRGVCVSCSPSQTEMTVVMPFSTAIRQATQ